MNSLKESFNSRKPFRYLVLDNFFHEDSAEEVLAAYPGTETGQWDGTTYVDQKNKFQLRSFEKNSLLEQVFAELNGTEFICWLQKLTGIQDMHSDDELFGGGLHQSTRGAFLNVHVDYNIHPRTKLHRRLNVLVYMNKNWKEEYEGHLELWDMQRNRLLERVAPTFNRCVIFETNEVSYHGHPKPLNTPVHVSRKSLATYYYTPERPEDEIAAEHNTKFINTEGLPGQWKRLKSGIKALVERKL